jgi:dihydrolipoamide dehydrogenase
MNETDLIIIGAGPGGYRAAELAAKNGLKVVIIEQNHLGGTCLNEGCIPTKCYARNAEAVTMMHEAETFGIGYDGKFDFFLEKARSRKDEVIATLRNGIATLLSHPDITVVNGEARFTGANTVAVDDAEYTAHHIIVATGSVPKVLCLKAPVTRPVLDSCDMFQLDRLPESLCIIGAGVIGMEFASIFSAFGSRVTVVEFLKECLPALDSDIAKRLRKVLEKRGVTFYMQSGVTAITPDGVTFQDKKGREQTVQAEQVLMAVGRAPRVFDHFGMAGFDYDVRTGIKVDEHMETTIKGIYAIGDCNGRQMLAHAAEAQAKTAVAHILNQSPSIPCPSPSIIPAAIFTYPEAACVGPGEDQLKELGVVYECRKAFHRANGKALAMNETEGMLKLFSEPDAGRILGCHAYGAHSADLVQEVCVLMCRQTTIAQLREMVHIHPTLSEMILTAAES